MPNVFSYEFKKQGEKAALLELGPRFTLRLKALQKGTFDTKYGEFEWILKVRFLEWKRRMFFTSTNLLVFQRHEMETTRRRFFL